MHVKRAKQVLSLALAVFITLTLAACAAQTPLVESQPGTSPQDELTNEALRGRVEERYGVEINWTLEDVFISPNAEPLRDEEIIHKFLVLLDEQLALYPDRFFYDLKEKFHHTLRFFLCSSLGGLVENSEMFGRTQRGEDTLDIAFDLTGPCWTDDWPAATSYAGCQYVQYGLHHEIGHALDEYIVNCAEGLPFDFYAWRALLPAGYQYYDDFHALHGNENIKPRDFGAPYLDESQKGVWFCDLYSQANREEHVASLFGYAMCPSPPAHWKAPHVQRQANYYFSIIRQVFGTGGWPKVIL